MYTHKEIENSLVLDIETASRYSSFEEFKKAEPNLAQLWIDKYHQSNQKREYEKNPMFFNNATTQEAINKVYLGYAGLYAEFAKVIAVSFGFFTEDKKTKKYNFDITNSFSHNEVDLLNDVKTFLNSLKGLNLSGFNIKGFDIPFLCKRYLANKIELPNILKVRGKKPWEMTFIDLMDDWKFGSFANTSLDVLCELLGIKSPKDSIQNYEVNEVYHASKDNLTKISEYCGKDVKATMECMLVLTF